ncbi:glycosyltransferase family 4 protein [Algisphaera agarilytica]|uniref:Glycosyltransferase involved in cell wall biosynthesis n=1 Tax=Algisphaera agarilytica TaxID=1385975 RepID=A0A7X0HAF2_9BACT|nr:glycosyltransferase family 4 protein [Algisphaera agarilytica]MBB6430780.1 glycosyltransferase involved in cell wall biosynthesis [Algisphaera agarilytica]
MQILFINQTYAPDVAASAQLLEDMARQFADAGHEVAIVTSRSLYGQAGAVLPRYEKRDGVEVHRVGVARFGKGSVRARTFDATMFYLAATFKAWRVRMPSGKPQVVVTLTSPPYIGFIGVIVRFLLGGNRRGRYAINWSMDLYPDVLTSAGIVKPESLFGRMMHRFNLWCMRRADRVVTVGRCMRDRVVGQGVEPADVEMISVWPVSRVLELEEARQPSSYREAWGLEDKFVVMYSGNLGVAHRAKILAEAAQRLQHRDDIRFVFVGGGRRRDEITKYVAEHGLTNVLEKDYEPREKLEDLLRLGDVHLITQRSEFTGVVVPSKLFGIMASCRPSLYVGPPEAEVARVLTESGGGQVCSMESADDLVAQIERLADDRSIALDMGQKAREAVLTSHTLRDRFEKFNAMLEGLLGPEAARAIHTPAINHGQNLPAKPLRVLFINQAYAPDAAATAQHCEDLARYLVEQGHGVSVIASRSIYGQKGADLPGRETRHGVHVNRVGLSLFGKRGIVLRAVDFGLFYVAAMWRAIWIRVPIGDRLSKPDVVVTLTTPPLIGMVGWMMRLLRRCRQVVWTMDLYPDVLVAAGVSKQDSLLTRFFAWLNRREIGRADRVVALGRCMKDLIKAKGIGEDHIEVIGVWSPNDPPEELSDPAESSYREEWGLEGKFVVQYSGNFGLAHDYQTFCDTILELRDRDDIVFLFAGGGKRIPPLKAFVEQHGLKNVMIQPYQPRERLLDLLSLADVHLISQSESFTGIVVPSKLFGIMAAGRTSLFVGPPDAEVARVLDETGGGIRFPLGDAKALADVILQLAHDPERVQRMGQAALDASRGEHHRNSRFHAWEDLLVEVVSQAPAPSLPVPPL